METFAVDKSFYDITPGMDLKDIWDTELDRSMQDVLRGNSIEWNYLEKDLPVILHDKLMTDAALGTTRPIKTEHSYSLSSDGDSLPESPNSNRDRIDEMEVECFPIISLSPKGALNCRPESTASLNTRLTSEITIKDEPFSETDSLQSSCPSSPHHHRTHQQVAFLSHGEEEEDDEEEDEGEDTRDADIDDHDEVDDYLADIEVEVNSGQCQLPSAIQTSSSGAITLGGNNYILTTPSSIISSNSVFSLPPTPPSCSSSEESEDTILHLPILTTSNNFNPQQHTKLGKNTIQQLSGRINIGNGNSGNYTTSTRHPIHTPLISSQPKGSTGVLMLTEEEKRTLVAEGYPVPTRLPLSKAEEKSLKKIRRKIKNKISAQESRRKKKEYMDQLERKVEILVGENTDYRKKIENLEGSNDNLLSQLAKLQSLVARTHPQLLKK